MKLDSTLSVAVGGDVTFTYTVTASELVELQFTSGKVADVVVSDGSGEQVWQWGHNRMFTQALQTRTVRPDAPLEQTFPWSDAAPGEYVAVAELAADRAAQAEATFQV
jgi:hypothetical protein